MSYYKFANYKTRARDKKTTFGYSTERLNFLATPRERSVRFLPDRPSPYWLDYLIDPTPHKIHDPQQLMQYYKRFHSRMPRLEALARPRYISTVRSSASAMGVTPCGPPLVPVEPISRRGMTRGREHQDLEKLVRLVIINFQTHILKPWFRIRFFFQKAKDRYQKPQPERKMEEVRKDPVRLVSILKKGDARRGPGPGAEAGDVGDAGDVQITPQEEIRKKILEFKKT